DPDGEEDPATGDEERCVVAYEAGGVVSPDREHQLSADDRAERAADAGDDYPQLAGLYPDDADRLSPVHGQHHVGVDVLPGEPEGTVSEDLVQDVPLRSLPDGAWRRLDDHQHQGCDGSSVWRAERLCAYSEVSREGEGREVAGEGV